MTGRFVPTAAMEGWCKSADPSALPEGEAQGKHKASIRGSSDSFGSMYRRIYVLGLLSCFLRGLLRTSEEQSLVLDSTAAVASPGMPLSIHGIHPIHARFRHVCCHFPGALYYFSFNGFSMARIRSVWKGCECNVLACLL